MTKIGGSSVPDVDSRRPAKLKTGASGPRAGMISSPGSSRGTHMVVFAAAVSVVRAAVEHAPSGRLDRDHHLALCGP